MKHGILSILVSLLGIAFVMHFNNQLAAAILEYDMNHNEQGLTVYTLPKVFKISALTIGLIGLFFGIKGIKKAKKLSVIGIFLALVLMIFSFVPFWRYFV